MQRLEYKVHGMDCAEEVAILTRALTPLVSDPSSLQFDVLSGKLRIELASVDDDAAVREVIARTGMKAERWETQSSERPGFLAQHGRALMCAVSGAGIALSLVVQTLDAGSLLPLFQKGLVISPWSKALLILAAIAGAWYVLPKAWYALRALRPDMNLLMTIAVAGAFVLGEWFEAAMVAFLFALALLLESWSVGHARRAVTALMALEPPVARSLQERDGVTVELEVSPEEIPIGGIFVVRPGERFPLDGVVVLGATSADESPITGESLPVPKEPGDEVFAGAINNEGVVEVQCTKRVGDSTLAHIIRLVEEAQSHRAPAERWVDAFARYYTPAMIAAAIIVAVALPLALGFTWRASIYQALVLLLIACPCALVISTPVSIVAGIASAARAGVLIKGGEFLEAAARLNAVAFDKTGTLTKGRAEVQHIVPLNDHGEAQLVSTAASIESRSLHPVGQAIVRYAEKHAIAYSPPKAYSAIPGKGAEAALEKGDYWIGSHRLLIEKGHDSDDIRLHAARMESAGQTVVSVGRGDHVCGLIAVADEPREYAARLVADLKAAGIRRVVMLTGDNAGTAKVLAEKLGVDEYAAELLPQDKVAHMHLLRQRWSRVAMVGDGVNDAPVMAASDLGIAMGVAGSDAALEAADVALMSDDLRRVPWLIRHARRTLAIIKQNVALALGVKAAVLLLALLGMASLWMAIAADMGASLLVIFNALRLLRVSP